MQPSHRNLPPAQSCCTRSQSISNIREINLFAIIVPLRFRHCQYNRPCQNVTIPQPARHGKRPSGNIPRAYSWASAVVPSLLRSLPAGSTRLRSVLGWAIAAHASTQRHSRYAACNGPCKRPRRYCGGGVCMGCLKRQYPSGVAGSTPALRFHSLQSHASASSSVGTKHTCLPQLLS